MADKSLLEAEIEYRKTLGQTELPLSKFEEALRAIGYRFDRRMDCRAPARYMTGDRAGESYPRCHSNQSSPTTEWPGVTSIRAVTPTGMRCWICVRPSSVWSTAQSLSSKSHSGSTAL